MISDIQDMALEAKSAGLAVVVWSYPRGGDISKEGETAIDIVAYAAHMAALVGAHIIKVKPPTAHIELEEAKKVYLSENINIDTLSNRIKHVVQSCFQGRRLVVFSGGNSKDKASFLNEIRGLYEGGATGSIIGRNSFQRPYNEALSLLSEVTDIYRGR
jgi:class I fructose-bisphosphate aldolase